MTDKKLTGNSQFFYTHLPLEQQTAHLCYIRQTHPTHYIYNCKGTSAHI